MFATLLTILLFCAGLGGLAYLSPSVKSGLIAFVSYIGLGVWCMARIATKGSEAREKDSLRRQSSNREPEPSKLRQKSLSAEVLKKKKKQVA